MTVKASKPCKRKRLERDEDISDEDSTGYNVVVESSEDSDSDGSTDEDDDGEDISHLDGEVLDALVEQIAEVRDEGKMQGQKLLRRMQSRILTLEQKIAEFSKKFEERLRCMQPTGVKEVGSREDVYWGRARRTNGGVTQDNIVLVNGHYKTKAMLSRAGATHPEQAKPLIAGQLAMFAWQYIMERRIPWAKPPAPKWMKEENDEVYQPLIKAFKEATDLPTEMFSRKKVMLELGETKDEKKAAQIVAKRMEEFCNKHVDLAENRKEAQKATVECAENLKARLESGDPLTPDEKQFYALKLETYLPALAKEGKHAWVTDELLQEMEEEVKAFNRVVKEYKKREKEDKKQKSEEKRVKTRETKRLKKLEDLHKVQEDEKRLKDKAEAETQLEESLGLKRSIYDNLDGSSGLEANGVSPTPMEVDVTG